MKIMLCSLGMLIGCLNSQLEAAGGKTWFCSYEVDTVALIPSAASATHAPVYSKRVPSLKTASLEEEEGGPQTKSLGEVLSYRRPDLDLANMVSAFFGQSPTLTSAGPEAIILEVGERFREVIHEGLGECFSGEHRLKAYLDGCAINLPVGSIESSEVRKVYFYTFLSCYQYFFPMEPFSVLTRDIVVRFNLDAYNNIIISAGPPERRASSCSPSPRSPRCLEFITVRHDCSEQ